MRNKIIQRLIAGSMREIVFGLEDSLVSTLGTITGIAVGTQNHHVVILSGLVLIATEATSMAAGSYLSSERAIKAEETLHDGKCGAGFQNIAKPFRSAVVMGVCYVAGGFVPFVFYFFLPVGQAIVPSIVVTIVMLFALGIWSAEFTRSSKLKGAVELTAISLAAAVVGYFIGRVVGAAFGIDMIL